MRIYLPLRTDDLAAADEAGVLPSRTAYAVTDAMRGESPADDEEDLEFDAMCAALDAAAALPGNGRRVVAAADVEVDPAAGGTDAEVGEVAGISLDDVVSFHVEEKPSDAGEGYDSLLWYDVTELAELV